MFALAMFMSLCVDVIVMSSVYMLRVIARRLVEHHFWIDVVMMFCF